MLNQGLKATDGKISIINENYMILPVSEDMN